LCEYSESSEDLQTYYNLRAVMHLSSGRIRESIECMDTIITLQPFHIVTIDKAAIALLDAQFAEHRNDAATVKFFKFSLLKLSFFLSVNFL